LGQGRKLGCHRTGKGRRNECQPEQTRRIAGSDEPPQLQAGNHGERHHEQGLEQKARARDRLGDIVARP
jgi:hypothetical protein